MQPCVQRRAAIVQLRNQEALLHRQRQLLGQARGDVITHGAQPGMWVTAARNQHRHHLRDRVDRNGKTNAGAGAAGAENGRVHANQPPQAVEQGAARIAAVDRSIGLDRAPQNLVVRFNRAIQRADDAGGQRALELTKRIADGNGGLSHAQRAGIACRQRLYPFRQRVHFDNGQVIARVGADHRGVHGIVVAKVDGQGIGILHHMVIGHNMPFSVPNKTGAAALFGIGAKKERAHHHATGDIDHRRAGMFIHADHALFAHVCARGQGQGIRRRGHHNHNGRCGGHRRGGG